jgi:hypothetical protein
MDLLPRGYRPPGRRPVAECRVRSSGVVLHPPLLDHDLRLLQSVKNLWELSSFVQGMDVTCIGGRICDRLRCQMPAYHAYPSSAPNAPEPKPLPNCLRLSVIVRRVMYLTFL